jgi:hypothetical protein
MSLRQWTLVMPIQSGWLFSAHHKKFVDFSCCCECIKIFNSGLICLVFVKFVRLFSDGLSELSVWVSYSSVVLTVMWSKDILVRAFAFAESFFLISRTWSSFGFFRTVFQSETLIGGMSLVLSVFGTVKECGTVVSIICVALLHLTQIGFCPCLFSVQ